MLSFSFLFFSFSLSFSNWSKSSSSCNSLPFILFVYFCFLFSFGKGSLAVFTHVGLTLLFASLVKATSLYHPACLRLLKALLFVPWLSRGCFFWFGSGICSLADLKAFRSARRPGQCVWRCLFIDDQAVMSCSVYECWLGLSKLWFIM